MDAMQIQGKVCMVTGASNGIGRAAAMGFARLGATVVLVCRNEQRGRQVVDEIRSATGNQNLHLLIADLSSQASVRQLASNFRAQFQRLHVLVNNAGVAIHARALSPDGIEMTFAVNHLGYFLLTNLLLDCLKAAAPSRIINVSSEAHRNARIDFENLQGEKDYSGFKAYCLSKLCNVLFTRELAGRLEGTGVTVNSMHPGFLRTGIFRETSGFLKLLVTMTAGSPEKGARAIVHLATSPEVENGTGKYFKGTRERPSALASQDRQTARRLWQISAQMTGLS